MREYNENERTREKEIERERNIWTLEGHREQGTDMENIGWEEKSGEGGGGGGRGEGGEAYVSEGNVLFSPPTGPQGFLGYPLVVYTPVYTIVLSGVRM